MNRFLKIFIILAVSFVVIGCRQPVGAISDGGTPPRPDVDHDAFWTVPRRQVYNLGDYFERNNDLWVFATSQGILEEIPVNRVSISIVRNPDAAVPSDPIDIDGNEFRLVAATVGAGRKLIVVSYGDKTAEYSIEVQDPHSLDPRDDPENGNGSGGTGIGIIWH